MSVSRWLSKQIVFYPDNGLFLSSKKKRTVDVYGIEGSENSAQWQKPAGWVTLYNSIHVKWWKMKTVESERPVVTWDGRRVGRQGCRKGRRKLGGWQTCSLSWRCQWSHGCAQLPKLVKFYTQTCSVSYANRASRKQLKMICPRKNKSLSNKWWLPCRWEEIFKTHCA